MSEASGAKRPGRAPRAPIAICGAILAGLTYALWTAGDDSQQAPRPPASVEAATSAAEADRTPSGSPGAAEHARAISPETLPTVLTAREIAKPGMGDAVADPDAAFCDARQWSRVGVAVSQNDAGELLVDREAWESRMTQTRVGLASWMSRCMRDGERVTIVARGSGAVLATYDPRSGYRSADP